ncbi:MAG: AraC family ligand binding domain-containing protein [Bacteroidota bacterium]
MKQDKIWYKNLINKKQGVLGICLVKRGFEAYFHQHEEAEVYFFLYGVGRTFFNNEEHIIQSPDIVHIKGNTLHCMTPISRYVLLLYYFPEGPFEKIEYKYTSLKL